MSSVGVSSSRSKKRTVGHARVGLPDVGLQDTNTDAGSQSSAGGYGSDTWNSCPAHLPSESMLGWYILLVKVICS